MQAFNVLAGICSIIGFIISIFVYLNSATIKTYMERQHKITTLIKNEASKTSSIMITIDSYLTYLNNNEKETNWVSIKAKIHTTIGQLKPYDKLFEKQVQASIAELVKESLYNEGSKHIICQHLGTIKTGLGVLSNGKS